MVIRNDTLARRLSPALLQQLIRIALRPLPCNVSFNTLIIRQYFNRFIEYLIDTYPGAARLLPMELQTEEVGDTLHLHDGDGAACFGRGQGGGGGGTAGGRRRRRCASCCNEARMKTAKALRAVCARENWSVAAAYTVLLVRCTASMHMTR